ncbi:DUF3540 domain-containing protein [Polyangium spumosum]|uniref:DUF3540 domain-containing protein n=1 Tax=Polyangium spumosum TaxID=889282 RepID=A0A6N7PQE4_9BACT|nr:DUF3540 domain-containing protein [Polyangium spumosum]MRG94288.1 DUF3540 domain-containing protein [Polyangium spumosum]
MVAPASILHEEQVIQETARVVADKPLLLRAGSVEYRAERAASCLLCPAVGDEVLVALLPDRRAFVLAVLTRDAAKRSEVRVDGDLLIASNSGRVSVSGPEGVAVVTPGDVEMVAGKITLRSAATALASEAITVVGKAVVMELDRVKLGARTLDSVLERFTQKVKRAIRTVEETDHLRAERIDYAAEKSLAVSAENAVVTARELVKMDGGQIHLG